MPLLNKGRFARASLESLKINLCSQKSCAESPFGNYEKYISDTHPEVINIYEGEDGSVFNDDAIQATRWVEDIG